MGGISQPSPVQSVNGQTGNVVIPAGAVDSVNGQTGVVLLNAADVGAVETVNGQGPGAVVLTAEDVGALSAGSVATVLLSGAAEHIIPIPAGARGVDIALRVASTNGANIPLIRLRDAVGGIITAGYEQRVNAYTSGPGVLFQNAVNGFQLAPSWAAATTLTGMFSLRLIDLARWMMTGSFSYFNSTAAGQVNGIANVTTAPPNGLDAVVITTATADLFDGGEAYVSFVL